VLPFQTRGFVEALSTATQTPPDLPDFITLAVLSRACAKRIVVRLRHAWIEPVNLYLIVVLGPGNRKSVVVRAVLAVVEAFEARWAKAAGAAIAEALNRQKIAEHTLARLQQKAANAVGKERDDLLAEADRLAYELEALAIPVPLRLGAADVTPVWLLQLSLCASAARRRARDPSSGRAPSGGS
jgi:hypothetical protein